MAKIMLVEDDNNLREIYEARLLAEGYEIVSAEDGEQALALAVKEKPDLIISDVMMPKISGFDMLDILRSTPETQNTKVIMMTALSQAEDKSRADKLGADKYLVKSQVTLEDVAKVAREVLEDDGSTPAAPVTPTTPPPPTTPEPPVTPPEPAPAVVATPVATPPADNTAAAPTPEPPVSSPANPAAPSPVPNPATPANAPTADPAAPQTTASEAAQVEEQVTNFVQNLPVEQQPNSTTTTPETPSVDATNTAADNADKMAHAVNDLLQKSDEPATPQTETQDIDAPKLAEPHSASHIAGKKVINPINDLSTKGPDLNALLAKEMSSEEIASSGIDVAPAPAPEAQEEQPVPVKPPGNVLQPGDPNNIAL